MDRIGAKSCGRCEKTANDRWGEGDPFIPFLYIPQDEARNWEVEHMAHDIEVYLGDNVLENGDCLEGDIVQGRIYGKPGAPLIVVPGGISASRFLADNKENGHGWWTELVFPGGPIDLDNYRVLGVDLAPTGKNVEKRVTITTHDQARRLGRLLDCLGTEKVHSTIGTSYGAMVLLAFAELYPNRVEKQCLLGATHRPFQMGVAWRGIERRIIDLGIAAGDPNAGLKLARELAMTTYRSPKEFSERFASEPTARSPIRFGVDDYLENCGRKYHEIMPVERFMALSESIDLHTVDPQKITTPTLLIATNTDMLAPPSEIEILHNEIAGPSEMITIESIFGHDSFLKEYDALGSILSDFVEESSLAA